MYKISNISLTQGIWVYHFQNNFIISKLKVHMLTHATSLLFAMNSKPIVFQGWCEMKRFIPSC